MSEFKTADLDYLLIGRTFANGFRLIFRISVRRRSNYFRKSRIKLTSDIKDDFSLLFSGFYFFDSWLGGFWCAATCLVRRPKSPSKNQKRWVIAATLWENDANQRRQIYTNATTPDHAKTHQKRRLIFNPSVVDCYDLVIRSFKTSFLLSSSELILLLFPSSYRNFMFFHVIFVDCEEEFGKTAWVDNLVPKISVAQI